MKGRLAVVFIRLTRSTGFSHLFQKAPKSCTVLLIRLREEEDLTVSISYIVSITVSA
jgi:hypothetical protein